MRVRAVTPRPVTLTLAAVIRDRDAWKDTARRIMALVQSRDEFIEKLVAENETLKRKEAPP